MHPQFTGLDDLRHYLTAHYDTAIRDVAVNGESFRMIMIRDSNHLVDLVDPAAFAADERLPYWAELWPSSIALAKYCLNAPDVPGAAVLELGCGLGLTGIAAARAGARVTMSDYDSDALLFATCNAWMNLSPETVRDSLRLTEMDWRMPPASGGYDLIIGADIVYERKSFGPIIDLLGAQLRPAGRAILTEPDREIGRAFMEQASPHFVIETAQTPVAWDNREFTITHITLRKRERRP